MLPRPLYIMVKPVPAVLPLLARQRAALGIDSECYSLDRLHSTFLRLGEATPKTIDLARCALDRFQAEPFPIAFDKVDGNLLKGCNALRCVGVFQRALAKHMRRHGCLVPAYRFWLHLCLTYGDSIPARRIAIPPIGWTVDEILLIRSVHGEGRHELLGRWPLVARQYEIEF